MERRAEGITPTPTLFDMVARTSRKMGGRDEFRWGHLGIPGLADASNCNIRRGCMLVVFADLDRGSFSAFGVIIDIVVRMSPPLLIWLGASARPTGFQGHGSSWYKEYFQERVLTIRDWGDSQLGERETVWSEVGVCLLLLGVTSSDVKDHRQTAKSRAIPKTAEYKQKNYSASETVFHPFHLPPLNPNPYSKKKIYNHHVRHHELPPPLPPRRLHRRALLQHHLAPRPRPHDPHRPSGHRARAASHRLWP